MNKTLKYSLIGVGVAATGLIVLTLLQKRRRNRILAERAAGSETPAPAPSTNTPSSIWGDDSFPLGYRSYGPKVVAVQLYLNEKANKNLVVDGKFGNDTTAAWKSEQYPFEGFLISFPNAVEGEMSEQYYNQFVKVFESRNSYKNALKDLGMS